MLRAPPEKYKLGSLMPYFLVSSRSINILSHAHHLRYAPPSLPSRHARPPKPLKAIGPSSALADALSARRVRQRFCIFRLANLDRVGGKESGYDTLCGGHHWRLQRFQRAVVMIRFPLSADH